MDIFNNKINQLLEMAYGLGPNTQSIFISQLVSYLLNIKESMTPFSVTQITKQSTRKAPYPKFTLSGQPNGATYFAKAVFLLFAEEVSIRY